MGIIGLHQFAAPALHKVNIKKFQGQVLGIDGHSWLHKGLVCCALDLLDQKPTQKHFQYCLFKAQLLLSYNVQPLIVFDGGKLPMKAYKEEEREASRNEKRRRLNTFSKSHNKQSLAAGSIDVTTEMVGDAIDFLTSEGIDCMVAPYEADAQLTFLYNEGTISGVISEDSDLIIFGCGKVLYKMDSVGDCFEYCSKRFFQLPELSHLNQERLLWVGILAGCDYLKNIPGVGLKTALNLVKNYEDLEDILEALRQKGKIISEMFEREFQQARVAFLHHIVYDPKDNVLCHLIPPTNPKEDLSFLGKFHGPNHIKEIVQGLRCPDTAQLFVKNTIPLQSITNSKNTKIKHEVY